MEGIYRIPAHRMQFLTEKIQYLAKIANKLGCQPIQLEVLGTEQTKSHGSDQSRWWYSTFYRVRITGEAPILNGWKLVARMERIDVNSNLVIPLDDDVPVPKYFQTSGNQCDHCQTHRRRSHLYVVYNVDTGEYLQVGSACLEDFTGHPNPHAFAKYAELMIQTIDAVREPGIHDDDFIDIMMGFKANRYVEPMIPIYPFLVRAATFTRKYGFVSRSRTEVTGKPSTASYVWTSFIDPQFLQKGKITYDPIEDDYIKAEETLMWISQGFGRTDGQESNYESVLSQCLELGVVTYSTSGYMASAIAAYERYIEQTVREQYTKQSQWVGNVGDRTLLRLYVTGVTTTEGRFGTTYIYKFIDSEGNDFVWFASNPTELQHSDTCDIKCTIKSHGEFRGKKNTVLTRCKVLKIF